MLACASMAAGAHNFHMGIADISYNPASGSTEVVHTYTGHDVETLLTNLYQRRFDLARKTAKRPCAAMWKNSFISWRRTASDCA